MKFTLSWLRDHLETDAGVAEIADALTMIGLEVEEIVDPGATFERFVIARVASAARHPNADRLQVLEVDPGDGALVQVICGAPNARAGLVGVFAPPGTHIPGTGIDLEVGTIRGVESRGMMLSERELGLSDDHEGIIDLPGDAPVGTGYAVYAGLDDPVFDIAITPNRADCLGVRGIARDLAAAGLGTLKPVTTPAVPASGSCPVSVTLDFADGASLCPAFALRQVSGVTNGASPDWLRRRLTAIGLRPINRLVDITNYLTYDRSRPLHVFDASKVRGDLVVRRARHGESILALDGKTYALDPSICVIADETGVESLAGVMGGEASGCTGETTDVLIESALWDEHNIAATGRKLGIHSDARYRFERSVDPAFTLEGLDLATSLVLDLCGGSASGVFLAGAIPETGRAIRFPLGEVRRIAGLDVAPERIRAVLSGLGFAVEAGDGDAAWSVTPPSWRADVEGKADLVEEIVRIVGIDAVAPTALERPPTVAPAILTPMQRRTRLARRALAARGLVEAVTWSFVPEADARLFGGGDDTLRLANPISADLTNMRPSLLPGLARATQANADRGYPSAALFEVGQVFENETPEGQHTAAAAIRRGTAKVDGGERHWSGAAANVDVFDAKADCLAVLEEVGGPSDSVQITRDTPGWLHPGRSGVLRLGPNVLGWFGELHPGVLEEIGADGPLAGFELLLDKVPLPRAKPTKARPALERLDLMPVRRDFAFVVGEDVAAETIVKAARGAEKQLIAAISVFDVYRGEAIGAGAKSVAIEVVLQPRERTMTDEEIEAVGASIVASVTKATGGTLRA